MQSLSKQPLNIHYKVSFSIKIVFGKEHLWLVLSTQSLIKLLLKMGMM